MQSCYEFAHLKPVTAFPPSARNHQHRIRLSQNAIKILNLRESVRADANVSTCSAIHVPQRLVFEYVCTGAYMKKRLPAVRERAESGLGLGASPARAQRSMTLNLHRHRASARFATPPRLAAGQAHSHAARRTLPPGGRDEQHPRACHGSCRPKRWFHRRWHHQSPEHTPGNCPPRHRADRSASRRSRTPLPLGTPGRSNPRSDHRPMPPTRRHMKCTVSARLSPMVQWLWSNAETHAKDACVRGRAWHPVLFVGGVFGRVERQQHTVDVKEHHVNSRRPVRTPACVILLACPLHLERISRVARCRDRLFFFQQSSKSRPPAAAGRRGLAAVLQAHLLLEMGMEMVIMSLAGLDAYPVSTCYSAAPCGYAGPCAAPCTAPAPYSSPSAGSYTTCAADGSSCATYPWPQVCGVYCVLDCWTVHIRNFPCP